VLKHGQTPFAIVEIERRPNRVADDPARRAVAAVAQSRGNEF
jgi:hypothetical protein